MTAELENKHAEILDVAIIGAGISGLSFGYRLTTMLPNEKFAIFEARGNIGGTWDLFDYPGARSDSDFFTFGFAWDPWQGETTLAEKDIIINYFNNAVDRAGFRHRIRFRHRVMTASWSTADGYWTVEVEAGGKKQTYHAGWVVFTSFYDYYQPKAAYIPNIDTFVGRVIHPQFWPKDFDYAGKDIVVIGSGATALSVVPALAKKAKRVTMVQRSPNWIVPMQNKTDWFTKLVQAMLPASWGHAIIRWRWVVSVYFFLYCCENYSNSIQNWLKTSVQKLLPGGVALDQHFVPSYKIGEQRICMVPDGDMFAYMREGKVDVITGVIDTVTERGLVMKAGTEVPADVLVTATGLKISFGAHVEITVDGEPYKMAGKYMWHGHMLQDLPNAGTVFGYTNASFTLGADSSAHLVCRLLKLKRARKARKLTPRMPPDTHFAKTQAVIDLKSNYVVEALHELPLTGSHGPWKIRKNYFLDMITYKYGNVTNDLEIV